MAQGTVTYSIVTGNGFDGNAQRTNIVADGGSNTVAGIDQYPYYSGYTPDLFGWKVEWVYRSSTDLELSINCSPGVDTNWTTNLGPAIYGSFIIEPGIINWVDMGNNIWRVQVGFFVIALVGNTEWFEIDNVRMFPTF